MKHLDLFSGIGGFALAMDRVWDNVEHTFCEIDPFCQEILKKHWPDSKIYGDISKFSGGGTTDLVTGGFPCQPFSAAGKRKGTQDDRHLWPEMLRVIREVSAKWVIGENVGGLVTWDGGVVLNKIISDLEAIGYEVWPLIIPACAKEAIHRRDRIWILAHHASKRRKKGQVQSAKYSESTPETQRKWSNFWFQHFGSNIIEFRKEDESFICGMDDGLPDRAHRIKALGNSIVPKIAEEIFKAIRQINETQEDYQ